MSAGEEARRRLRQRKRADPFAAGHLRQILLFLFLVTQRDDAGGADAGVVTNHRGKAIIGSPHHLFDGALGRAESGHCPPYCSGMVSPNRPISRASFISLVGNRIFFFDLPRAWIDFLAQKAGDFVGVGSVLRGYKGSWLLSHQFKRFFVHGFPQITADLSLVVPAKAGTHNTSSP